MEEQYLYGSKRLGVRRPGLEMARANRVVGDQRAAFLLTAEARRFLWPLNGCTYHNQVAALHRLLISVPQKTASAAEATEPFGRRCFRSSAGVHKEKVGGFKFDLRFGGRASQSSWLLSNHPSPIAHPNHPSSIAHLNHKSSTTYAWFKADVSTAQDYYPFGSLMPGRTYVAPTGVGYRFGFNGMQRDDEIKGPGNSLDFGARMYDSRLGRWWSLDPLMMKYPSFSPYLGMGNGPVCFFDGDGRDIIDGKMTNPSTGKYYDAYVAFKMTPSGTDFLKRFTSGNDSRFSDLRNKQGDLDKLGFTFRVRMQEPGKWQGRTYIKGDIFQAGVEAVARTYLKVGNKEVSLGSITAEDVANSQLQFTFEAIMAAGRVNEEDAATLGHEVFLHLQNNLKAIEALKGQIKSGEIANNDYDQIAKRLRAIAAERGPNGDNDHKDLVNEGQKSSSYLKFLNQLKGVLGRNAHKVESHLQDEINQYGN